MDVHSRLDELLAARGRMNFTIDCACAGGPARLTMDDKQVYLATAEDGGRILADVFTNVDSSGSGASRTLRLGSATFDLTFADAYDADRFGRVLGVRRAPVPTTKTRFSTGGAPGTVGSSHAVPGATLVGATNVQEAYVRNLGYTMMASAVLIGVGWLAAAGGALIAVVALFSGHALLALYGLLLAVTGAALPLTVGHLARTVVYRFQFEDARGSR